MLLSLLASAAAVVAGLLFLASLLMSGAFAGRVPTGPDAMGLVVPLFGSIGAAVLLLIASGLLGAAGRLTWIGAHGGWIAAGVMLGVGIAAVGVLIAWMERMGGWVWPLGLFCGGVAPLLASLLLLHVAWRQPASLQAATGLKIAAATLLLSALCGLVLGAYGGWRHLQLQAANNERALAAQAAEDIESARRETLSPVERLREDYAGYSPDAPLWVFVAGLPDPTAAEVREVVITRALQVPNLDADLERTLADTHPRYRHGAVEMIRHAPESALKPQWAAMLAQSLRVSAGQITENPQWLVPDDFANPDPAAHVVALVAATQRFAGSDDLTSAITQLHDAVARLPASPDRERALAAFASH